MGKQLKYYNSAQTASLLFKGTSCAVGVYILLGLQGPWQPHLPHRRRQEPKGHSGQVNNEQPEHFLPHETHNPASLKVNKAATEPEKRKTRAVTRLTVQRVFLPTANTTPQHVAEVLGNTTWPEVASRSRGKTLIKVTTKQRRPGWTPRPGTASGRDGGHPLSQRSAPKTTTGHTRLPQAPRPARMMLAHGHGCLPGPGGTSSPRCRRAVPARSGAPPAPGEGRVDELYPALPPRAAHRLLHAGRGTNGNGSTARSAAPRLRRGGRPGPSGARSRRAPAAPAPLT